MVNGREPILRLDGSTSVLHRKCMRGLVAYVDGGSHGNPGPSGIGVVIEGAAAGTIRISRPIGRQDSNVAEYVALMEALQYAISVKAKQLHIYSDSQVVVKQMIGKYQCCSPKLYSLNWTCKKLARSLGFSLSYVARRENAEANALANLAITRIKDNAATFLGGERPRTASRKQFQYPPP